jgi:hypothetical protein
MILLFTVKAECEPALLASPIVLNYIYLCRLCTTLNGTPSEIFHAIYGTAYAICVEFLNYFLRQSDFPQIRLSQERGTA